MKLIDTHVHWNVEAFKDDLPDAISRARAAGVEKFVIPGIDKLTHGSLMEVAARFPGTCFPCVGLHPTDVRKNWKEELVFVEQQLFHSGFAQAFVAIGETGIDLYHDKTFVVQQKTVFEQQLRWSVSCNLPVIVHARDSFDIIFDVLNKVKPLPLRGVFHAYSGNIELFKRISRYGHFKIGVGGVVTFKNAHLAEVVRQLSLEHIVLETDAPWLAPVPHRGQRNESSHLSLIVKKIAELKNCTVEEVAEITTRNAEKLFSIP